MVYIFFINFFYQDREDEIRDVMEENYPSDEDNGKFQDLKYNIPPIETTIV